MDLKIKMDKVCVGCTTDEEGLLAHSECPLHGVKPAIFTAAPTISPVRLQAVVKWLRNTVELLPPGTWQDDTLAAVDFLQHIADVGYEPSKD